MAFERPVVASAIDGIPEAISDGVEGFLVPPADEQSLYERVNSHARGTEAILKVLGYRCQY